MRIRTAEVKHFGSYESLTFDFDNQGLALIQGATGSGKSTLQDIVPWIVFGETAKGGNVDDIRSWTSPAATTGVLTVETPQGIIQIHRTRGKQTENDLYILLPDGTKQRGSNINETQDLIRKILGMDYNSFTIGAYYNEFSPTRSFFTAKASERRELLENLANMDLPIKLSERIADVKKINHKSFIQISEGLSKEQGRLEQLRKQEIANKTNFERWGQTQASRIKGLELKNQRFEAEVEEKVRLTKEKAALFETQRELLMTKMIADKQKQIDKHAQNSKCVNCDYTKPEHQHDLLELSDDWDNRIKREFDRPNPYKVEIDQSNPYGVLLEQALAETNPYSVQDVSADIQVVVDRIQGLETQLKNLKQEKSRLNQLKELIAQLRERLLENTVKNIESETNRYLESYFDAEIRVALSAEGAENIDVVIRKSGYECNYRQLSKGQRGLLKLAFSVSAMRAVSDKIGIQFNTLFFDEALDGLSEDLKVKAFNLFSELSLRYSTVLVIDHNEQIKSLFPKQYCVKINSDISSIEEM